MKRLKAVLVPIAGWLGHRLPNRNSRRWFCDKIIPYLMDPAILPHGLVERRARRFDISVLCDPYVYVHRNGYWCGVFFEEEVESYLARTINKGDTVIDVGMNVGHVTVPAAALVGAEGKVIAFEPNLDLVRRVQRLAQKEALSQVEILPYGLARADGTFQLRMEPAHAGGATFRDAVATDDYTIAMTCEVKCGDAVLRDRAFTGKVFLKMDVEGFELEALSGLQQTLTRVDHAIIEVSPEWLSSDGVAALFELMAGKGLCAFEIQSSGELGNALRPEDVRSQVNVAFVR